MKQLQGESLKIIVIILMGWSGFAFADAITKEISQRFDPALILLFGGVLSGSGLFTWILVNKGWRGFLSPNWKWLMARGACIAVTATGVVNAVALIPLADLYGITFTAPFLTVIMAALFLKEEVGLHRWLSVIIGLCGVFILLGPQFETVNLGIIYAIIAMFSIAIGTIVIRKVGPKEYLPLFILYPYIGILLVNIPLAIPHLSSSDFTFPVGLDLLMFVLNAAFVLIAQLLVTYSIANAKATATLAPFVYIQVIWGVLFGILFFGNIPTGTTILGLIVIVCAGLYMIYREGQLNKKINKINR